MKKISVFLAVAAMGFANAKELPSKAIESKDVCYINKELVSLIHNEATISEKEETPVRITCSTTMQIGSTTLTVTASSGNLFTSAETAALNCTKKLQHKLVDLMYEM